MSEGDPALGVVQMALEPGDTPVYDWQLNWRVMNQNLDLPSPGFILDFQGIVDHYIQPPTSNAQTLAMGLGLGITHDMAVGNNGNWINSYDTDLGFYPQNPGFECEDPDSGNPTHSNCFSNDNHDFRAFMPFFSAINFGGWKNALNTGAIKNWGRVVLPTRGKSLIVQLNNDGYNVHYANDDSGHYQTNKQDGHEAMWQHLGPKLQYQCFLKSALRSTTNTPVGSAIINDDVFRTGGDNSLTGASECCAHRFDVLGVALMDNCSACAQYVCTQPGTAYCCQSGGLGWNQGCIDAAKPPLPPPNCNAWTEHPFEIPCAGCPGNTPTCGNPDCTCTGGWWQPPPPPPPPQCDPGNPDR